MFGHYGRIEAALLCRISGTTKIMRQFISPDEIIKSAGTWTNTYSSYTMACTRTAEAAAFNLFIPIIILPSNESPGKGVIFKSVDVFYKIATANLTAFTSFQINKIVVPISQGTASVGTAITSTADAAHASSGNRGAQTSHRMTITLTNLVTPEKNDSFCVYLVLNAPATTVFTLYGAQVNFELRL